MAHSLRLFMSASKLRLKQTRILVGIRPRSGRYRYLNARAREWQYVIARVHGPGTDDGIGALEPKMTGQVVAKRVTRLKPR
jgi:hypothetical protein